MLLQVKAMAVAEAAISVKYVGSKQYAVIDIDADGGTGFEPLVQVGVSDVSLAAAVTNKLTMFTGVGAGETIEDLVANIANAISPAGTADDAKIYQNDFLVRIENSIKADVLEGASAAKFADDTTNGNLVGAGWYGTLVWDNDSADVGHVSLRMPEASLSEAATAIRKIQGVTTQTGGTALTSGLKREILDEAGTVLWTVSEAVPTSANMEFDLGDPIIYPTPVLIRDSVIDIANAAEVDATSTTVTWGNPPHQFCC